MIYFYQKKKDINDLRDKYNADICEMELAGIFITFYNNNVPCISIKSISDDGSASKYEENAVKAAKKHVELIDRIVKEI